MYPASAAMRTVFSLTRAELCMERDALQFFLALCDRSIPIVFEIKAGILKPGLQDLFRTFFDRISIVRTGVAHHNKMVGQLAVVAPDGEIFLVILHDRDQQFFRQGKIVGSEGPEHRDRIFDQIGDMVEERLVFDQNGIDSLNQLVRAVKESSLCVLPDSE